MLSSLNMLLVLILVCEIKFRSVVSFTAYKSVVYKFYFYLAMVAWRQRRGLITVFTLPQWVQIPSKYDVLIIQQQKYNVAIPNAEHRVPSGVHTVSTWRSIKTPLSDNRPGSVPTLEIISRAASSVGVMYRSHGPITWSNPGGGQIPKKNTYIFFFQCGIKGKPFCHLKQCHLSQLDFYQ